LWTTPAVRTKPVIEESVMDQVKYFSEQSGYYSEEELAAIGFKSFGENVLISRRASIYKPEAISFGSHVRVDDFCLLSGGAGISLGHFVHIAAYSALFGGAGITIGDFSGVAPRCTVLSESDDFLGRSLGGPMVPEKYKKTASSAPVIFGKHCAMGASSTVLPGVEFAEGSGCVAHSLVVKSCDPWTINVGAPVNRVVRRRWRSQILELERQLREEMSLPEVR